MNKKQLAGNNFNFQMMVEIFKKKLYRGGFQTAKDAAEYYDRLSINVFGLKVRSDS